MSRAATRSLTPIVRQHDRIRSQYPDMILLFRLGDFRETVKENTQITMASLR